MRLHYRGIKAKQLIYFKLRIRLYFAGNYLEDNNATLEYYNIKRESSLIVGHIMR